ncbi:MAG: plasmid pRiA4b ORF-3 family protein [Pseudonocardiaceae bacterium]
MPISPSSSSGSTFTPIPTLYQLRAVLHAISPLIWRRLLIPADTTIAELHTIMQTAFGWSGEHLHRLVIHGREYGIAYPGGPWFRDDPRSVRVADLGLRQHERFTYQYNFTAGWQLDLRVEQIADPQPGRTYPRCVGGRRAGPPEDWDGPWEFVQRTQPFLVFDAITRAAEIVGRLLGADADLASIDAHRDELAALLPLLGLERFDRRACNQALATRAAAGVQGSRDEAQRADHRPPRRRHRGRTGGPGGVCLGPRHAVQRHAGPAAG